MDYSIAIDTIWVLIAAAFVFFMQAGFAMVETGFTRAKNAGNIIMKNLMDFSVGSLVFWFIGFGIMFGSDVGGLIGSLDLMATGTYEHLGLTIPKSAFLIFQTVFCATAATIVSGAMAERTKFKSYLVYSFFICLIIYPISGHWIWGGGWLANMGFRDFAGSTAVHSVGGWAALMGAFVLGPRVGKYGKDGKPNAMPGHSLTLGALGVFILWFGWFGFNPGSTIAGMAVEDISHIFMTTNLSAAACAVVTMFFTWIKYGKPDVSMTLNGALGGLVAITAGCDAIGMGGAVLTGALTSFVMVFGIEFVDKVLKIDDPVGAIGVHGISGAFGTLCVGLFATDGGLFFGGGSSLLTVQAIGVIAVGAWTLATGFIIFKAIDAAFGLRVTEEEEKIGLDIEEHGCESYADFAPRALGIK
ncbi:ammonium transporter (TC 1.A.11) [Dethiosulfatibacter aminovorans DSM 17477]|uniref:Ammonium transporter n=1 Tax=Dethiosulfatibacter aminovorans DSM 17477 TaxID=1121476 RepID=A0A1M6DP76_9FIRM|nr:ammonium transporter [Dethiosulfatibacter aminovorans]SHI74953.1 ammonium transporter (TC 1.A.11) [Dethiosulfatibacter aminovorans DSM 17477]